MIVFTLPSHDLVFKVIRDRFGAPKHATRAEVMERYRFVFRHDRAGRMVDAQEFKRLSLPMSRFMPVLAQELLSEASESCRLEGEELIIEHCYIERRLRPLNLFLREAEPAAAEAAIVDYGNALRDMASTNIFAGDLLLKNFGVTRHGRVIFYDYDEVSLLGDCEFRDLPTASCEEEETSAEPWFYVGPRDVFPEQWLPFLAMPASIREVFLARHAELLTARWWRSRQALLAPPVSLRELVAEVFELQRQLNAALAQHGDRGLQVIALLAAYAQLVVIDLAVHLELGVLERGDQLLGRRLLDALLDRDDASRLGQVDQHFA